MVRLSSHLSPNPPRLGGRLAYRAKAELLMSAMFQVNGGGIGVMPDPADNAASHNVPHRDSGTRISFEVLNAGDQDGVADVGVEFRCEMHVTGGFSAVDRKSNTLTIP
jgi:hypothetical protein